MIQRKTASAPENIRDYLRSLVSEGEEMLTRKGLALGERELERLKHRFDDGIGQLREQYSDMEERMRAYWEDIEANLKDHYDDIERKLRRKARAANRSIRRHPYRSMGVVFGLGVAIGAILGWRKD